MSALLGTELTPDVKFAYHNCILCKYEKIITFLRWLHIVSKLFDNVFCTAGFLSKMYNGQNRKHPKSWFSHGTRTLNIFYWLLFQIIHKIINQIKWVLDHMICEKRNGNVTNKCLYLLQTNKNVGKNGQKHFLCKAIPLRQSFLCISFTIF